MTAARVLGVNVVAGLVNDRVKKGELRTFDDVLERFPELRDGVRPGYLGDSDGLMSFCVLHRNPRTRGVIVLAAMWESVAPPHLHRGGELTIGLSGYLRDAVWKSDRFMLERVPQGVPSFTWEPGS